MNPSTPGKRKREISCTLPVKKGKYLDDLTLSSGKCDLPVNACSQNQSSNVDSPAENYFPAENSTDVKKFHSLPPHVSLNQSIENNDAGFNLKSDLRSQEKKYVARPPKFQWKIRREKYLKLKDNRLANKLVTRAKRLVNKLVTRNVNPSLEKNIICDKPSSKAEQLNPDSHVLADISNDFSLKIQTMSPLAPPNAYFSKEVAVKVVSDLLLLVDMTVSLKSPLKLTNKLYWKYYLNFLSNRINRFISNEKVATNASLVATFRLLLKYPFMRHLIRHSNNGLNGDLKYLLHQAFKEYRSVSFTKAVEDFKIPNRQNDETLSENVSDVKSSIEPINSVVNCKNCNCNLFQNIPSMSNITADVFFAFPHYLTRRTSFK
ncbi:hypothetical protein AVEN_10387-1 [Araneus ventricosus]|uniref:Uncharacterized protein n=1 Tax=Araneus ventricosus TaxID=182803 RepID=A0A4Y2GZD6_ARAVE|nr:hypothetical protein AVEN_10387-1 [Araneus ventricosus]